MARVFTITEGLENMGAMKTGGQGSVYKGRRIGEIITAIKLLPTPIYSESTDDKNFISFQNEVQKLKKVNEEPNPNVVKILSSGITDSGNFPYIEMEFIEGPDLEDLLKPPHHPIFTIKEILKVADQLSFALAHCHKVDVRHGDIKSNNVKFNTRTGNYVLLDFGLSVMSDEERRSSLRHAGAIEFMAPEQNEGQMFPQTDVYSFGIILFELIAGTVPFPLRDKGETTRNHVMIAHMETQPPDMLALRQQKLPAAWDINKRDEEMMVPEWLVKMVYKCLEKNKDDRFENGVALHEFIWKNSIQTIHKTDSFQINNRPNGDAEEQLQALLQENKRLFKEKENLQQQLAQYQQGKSNNGISTTTWILIVAGLAILSFFLYNQFKNKSQDQKITSEQTAKPEQISLQNVVGEYKVTATRAYFYNEADENTRRNAWAIPSGEIIKAYDDKSKFIYTQITNEKGQVSKGWLRKQDLMTLADWNAQERNNTTENSQAENQQQLREARNYMIGNDIEEALKIYQKLSEQNVPEAMYQYANLALQNKNENLNCADAFELLSSASNAGYTPAKRTLGFLYSFADNEEVLKQANYYERCTFTKNLSKGSQLLIQAMLKGDSTASRYLDDLNIKR